MSTVSTRTVAVNAAFFQEIKEDNRELRRLLGAVGEMFSLPESDRVPAKELVDLLEELRDQFTMHFTLEEAYGYFDDAVDIAPRLSEQADSLRSEHEALFRNICDLVEEAERLLYHEPPFHSIKTIALRFVSFRHQFHDHEDREEELILQSLDDDIGVGD